LNPVLCAVTDATKLLHILENPSTPVPKKRMLMNATFGDYRKKMADELKQIDARMCVFWHFNTRVELRLPGADHW